MNILFYRWDTHIEKRILDAFAHLGGYEVTSYFYKIKDYLMDADLAKEVLFLIHEKKTDCIFSIDFIPILSEIAKAAGIIYISWLQDSPNLTMYYPCVAYESNYIFSFDSAECRRIRERTGANIYYCPLAADTAYFSKIIKESKLEVEEKICFLGTSYKNLYYDKAKGFTSYETGYYEALMEVASNIYGISLLEEVLNEDNAKVILEKCNVPYPQNYLMTEKELATYVLEQKMSSNVRLKLLPMIADKYPVNLYSGKDDWKHPNIAYKGYADYETMMPVIFNRSAINLNFTLRSIHSGIPLRIFDVLACEGFLLTNYQEDLADAFVPGEELAVYESREDLLEKVDYHMKKPQERRRIAVRGKEKVEKYFTYERQLQNIFSKVESELNRR